MQDLFNSRIELYCLDVDIFFHFYNTKIHAKECGLLMQQASSIFNNNYMRSHVTKFKLIFRRKKINLREKFEFFKDRNVDNITAYLVQNSKQNGFVFLPFRELVWLVCNDWYKSLVRGTFLAC